MTKQYKKSPLMVARKIGDELILVPIKHNVGDLQCIYTLNGVASRLWELIDGGSTTTEQLVSALTSEYEVEAEQARSDVADFLNQIEEIGAIEATADGK